MIHSKQRNSATLSIQNTPGITNGSNGDSPSVNDHECGSCARCLAFVLEFFVSLNKPCDKRTWERMQPLLPGESSWHCAKDMIEQIVPGVYCGGITIMAIKNGEDGEGVGRRGRQGGGGRRRGGGPGAVGPEEEEVFPLLRLRRAPVPQQRPPPPPPPLGAAAAAAVLLVARADPAPAAHRPLRAGLLLDERGERHEPAPPRGARMLAPLVVVVVRRRRLR